MVLGVSRLVPRKGFDVLLRAASELDPCVQVAIAGGGRQRPALDALVEKLQLGARARLLGRVPDDALALLYGSADVFAMPCRDRWLGLEAEGFGIVFLEAAACGVPVVAGRSGGSHEAVVDGVTGFVVDGRAADEVGDAVRRLLVDRELREHMGLAARDRAVTEFSYERLVERLAPIARGDLASFGTLR
jgi:phosphatidylinositol alpha-1,6-mannosyltransferase